MKHDELINGKSCADPDCSERIIVRGENEEQYVTVANSKPDEFRDDKLYYHPGCAPFGATRIPQELEL